MVLTSGLYLTPSVATDPIYLPPLVLQLLDTGGSVITTAVISCSVSVSDASVTLFGVTQVTTIAGLATFSSLGITATTNTTIYLIGSCVYRLGDPSIVTLLPITFTMASISPMWSLGPLTKGPCGVARDLALMNAAQNASALALLCNRSAADIATAPLSATLPAPPLLQLNLSASYAPLLRIPFIYLQWSPSSLSWYILSPIITPTGVPLSGAPSGWPLANLLPAALPSTLSSTLPLTPTPTAALLSSGSSGAVPHVLYDKRGVTCTLQTLSRGAAAITLGAVASSIVTDATVIVGDPSTIVVQGAMAWPRVGIQGAPFGGAAAVATSCSLPTRETVISAAAILAVYGLSLSVITQPPSAFLPSGASVSSLSPITPAPSFLATLTLHGAFTGGLPGGAASARAALYGTPCSVSPFLVNGSSPSVAPSLVGSGLLTTYALSSNATFDLGVVGVAVAWGGGVAFTASCSWSTGETFSATTNSASAIFTKIAWIPGSAPDAFALPNSPLAPVGLAALFSYDGGGAWRQDWTSLSGNAEGGASFQCSFALSYPPGGPVFVLSGAKGLAGLSVNGTSLTSALSIQSLDQNSVNAANGTSLTLCASCVFRGSMPVYAAATAAASGGNNSSGNSTQFTTPLCSNITLQSVAVRWLTPLVSPLLPTSQVGYTPISPPPAIHLVNGSGAPLTAQADGSCTLSLTTLAAADALPSLLVGDATVSMIAGVAVWSNVAVSASLGSRLSITATCSRTAAGAVVPATALINVVAITAQLLLNASNTTLSSPAAAAAATSAGGTSLQVLYGTPFSLAALTLSNLSSSAGASPQALNATPVGGILCTLAIRNNDTSAADTPTLIISSESRLTSSTMGTAVLRATVTTKPAGSIPSGGLGGWIYLTCSVADRPVVSPAVFIVLEAVVGHWKVPPPSVWLPTSGFIRNPIYPPPSLLFYSESGLPVSSFGIACTASVNSSSFYIAEAPPTGWSANFPAGTAVQDGLIEIGADGVVVSFPPSLLAAEAAAADAAKSDPTVTLSNLLIACRSTGSDPSCWNADLELTITCVRAQGDTASIAAVSLRTVNGYMTWITPPPSTVSSQELFEANLVLSDGPWGGGGGALVTLDSFSSCVIGINTSNSQIIVQGGTSTSREGNVTFPAVSISAQSGMVLQGYAYCSLGTLQWKDASTFSVSIAACPAGSIASGYACQVCGSGTYSDGGSNATVCIQCPSLGVQCTGGLLALLPGYYRADSGGSIDSNSEFHACEYPEACLVNSSIGYRSASTTSACAVGYTGVLCGVCDPAAADGVSYSQVGDACIPCGNDGNNKAILVILLLVLLAACAYVTVARTSAAEDADGSGGGLVGGKGKSPPSDTPGTEDGQVALKIMLTHLQCLGILGGLFVAKGTNAFRSMFSLAAAVGTSPFSLAPVQCTLRPSAFSKYSFTVSLPFILCLICVLFAIVIGFLRTFQSRRKQRLAAISGRISPSLSSRSLGSSRPDACANVRRFLAKHEYLSIILFVINLGYPSVTSHSFSMLTCTPQYIAGRRYLVEDLNIDCGTPTYATFAAFAMAMIGIYSAGFPFMMMYMLYRNRNALSDPEVSSKFGFMLPGYRLPSSSIPAPGADAAAGAAPGQRMRQASQVSIWGIPPYAWESIVLLRKAGVVMIGSLLTYDGFTQGIAATLFLTLALFLHASALPYARPWFNAIESSSLSALILTVCLSMIFLRMQEIQAICASSTPTAYLPEADATCQAYLLKLEQRTTWITFILITVNFIVLLLLGATFAWGFSRGFLAKRPDGNVATFLRLRCDFIYRRFFADLNLPPETEGAAGSTLPATSIARASDLGKLMLNPIHSRHAISQPPLAAELVDATSMSRRMRRSTHENTFLHSFEPLKTSSSTAATPAGSNAATTIAPEIRPGN